MTQNCIIADYTLAAFDATSPKGSYVEHTVFLDLLAKASEACPAIVTASLDGVMQGLFKSTLGLRKTDGWINHYDSLSGPFCEMHKSIRQVMIIGDSKNTGNSVSSCDLSRKDIEAIFKPKEPLKAVNDGLRKVLKLES